MSYVLNSYLLTYLLNAGDASTARSSAKLLDRRRKLQQYIWAGSGHGKTDNVAGLRYKRHARRTRIVSSVVLTCQTRNSSEDETANVNFFCYDDIFNNFYAVRPGSYPNSVKWRKITAIKPFKVIQGHRLWYQSKAHIRLPISD